MHRNVIISLHGIRTRGEWQKKLAPLVSSKGWTYYPLDYGFFFALTLLIPFYFRSKKVEWLRNELDKINTETNGAVPSIIVHSFGSYLLSKILEKHTCFKFDRIILTGSIIKKGYDWDTPLNNRNVQKVHNLTAKKDFWSRVAEWCVIGAGQSGVDGFDNLQVCEVPFKFYGHSDTHHTSVFKDTVLPLLDNSPIIEPSPKLELNLPLVQPIEAASWSAATYHKQYVERFRMAVANQQFIYADDKSNVGTTPNTLKILLPETCSQAESYSRDEIHKLILGRPILFGNGKDTRSAFLGDDGIVYDLPSIAASFSILDNFHNQQGASSSAIKDFKDIINRIAKGMTGQLDHTVIAEDFKPQKL
jgi:hypothetical protein